MGGFELTFQAAGIKVVDDEVMFEGDLFGGGVVEGFVDATFLVEDGGFLVEGSHGLGKRCLILMRGDR